MENNSKVYFNGSKWETNSCGWVTVIGRSDRERIKFFKGRRYVEHPWFYIKFEDGTIMEAYSSTIKRKGVKNPMQPNVYGIGYLGIGKHKAWRNKKDTKEYKLWHGMMERCYSDKWHLKKPTYKQCKVDERWRNFQNFCNDIPKIYGYENWKKDRNTMNKYVLDKDIKIKGNKIYSKNNCLFVTRSENSSEAYERNRRG